MRARRLALYFVAWTAAGLFFFSQDLSRKLYFDDPTPWWHYFVSWLVGVWIFAALTPAIVWLGRRFPVGRRNWPRRIPLHVGMSLVFAAISLLLVSLILPPILRRDSCRIFSKLPSGIWWLRAARTDSRSATKSRPTVTRRTRSSSEIGSMRGAGRGADFGSGRN
jgi:H+/Cl- antiporter ClcA